VIEHRDVGVARSESPTKGAAQNAAATGDDDGFPEKSKAWSGFSGFIGFLWETLAGADAVLRPRGPWLHQSMNAQPPHRAAVIDLEIAEPFPRNGLGIGRAGAPAVSPNTPCPITSCPVTRHQAKPFASAGVGRWAEEGDMPNPRAVAPRVADVGARGELRHANCC